MAPNGPNGPLIIEVDETPLPDAPTPAQAPPPTEPEPAPTATARAIQLGARRGWTVGRLALATAGGLLALWLAVSLETFLSGLFLSHGWLGWIGLALVSVLIFLLLVLALREMAALARLGRIEQLRTSAEEALATGSSSAAAGVLDGLDRLYRGRADLEWGQGRLRAAAADTPDAADRLAIAERELLSPLDARAEDAVRRAARDVAAATALIPLAMVDVLAALTCNLRMIRQIAEIYGGRAGLIGSWRLMRAVAAHLVATGAVAVADDLLGPMVGGGVLAKLSRRVGEGALNGALTARVGVAAIEVCRPMPFTELDRPSASNLILTALKAWRRDGQASAPS